MAVSEKNPVNGEASMEEIWAAASRDFERVCGMSLKNGDVKSFDDVQRRIERSGNAETEDNWDAAKSLGLKSLKFLKTLVGAASQASSLV